MGVCTELAVALELEGIPMLPPIFHKRSKVPPNWDISFAQGTGRRF